MKEACCCFPFLYLSKNYFSMRYLLTSLFALIFVLGFTQVDTFQNETLLYQRYVDPEACDYPFNISYFYSYEEYLELKFNGVVNRDSLYAEREWFELDDDEDTTYYKEVILIYFGDPEHGFRSILFGSYHRYAYVGWDDETDEFWREWTMHSAVIDYVRKELRYTYLREPSFYPMHLLIEDPNVENIEFLKYLCYFYRNEDHKTTTFSMDNVGE